MKQKLYLAGSMYYHDICLKNKRGTEVNFGSGDQNTIARLQDLPIADILTLLDISNSQLRCYLLEYYAWLKKEVLKTINQVWVYKMDDSIFQWQDHDIPGIPHDFKVFSRALKSKRPQFGEKTLEDVIRWFTNEDSEVKPPRGKTED